MKYQKDRVTGYGCKFKYNVLIMVILCCISENIPIKFFYILGNAKEMEYANASISSPMEKETQSFQKKGKTVSYLSIDGKLSGYDVIGDKIEEANAKAITALQGKGIDVIMLTGDSGEAAQALAYEIDLAYFNASMLPENKLRVVEKLLEKGKIVAMAGDGLYDAPGLGNLF